MKSAFMMATFLAIHGISHGTEVNINGSISQTYLQTTGNEKDWQSISNAKDGSFEFAEILLGVNSELTDKLRAGAQLISRDFGNLGNFETALDWGFGDYRHNEMLGVRAGKMKLPMGMYNESRDVDGGRTNILLDQGIYPEEWRGFIVAYQGLGLYGTLESNSGRGGSLEYQVYAGGINIPDDFYFIENLKKGIDEDLDGMNTKSLMGFQLGYYPSFIEGLKINTTFNTWDGSADMHLYKQNGYNAGAQFKTLFGGAGGLSSTLGASLDGGTIEKAVNMSYDTYVIGFEYNLSRLTFFGEYQQIYIGATYDRAVTQAAGITAAADRLANHADAAGAASALASAGLTSSAAAVTALATELGTSTERATALLSVGNIVNGIKGDINDALNWNLGVNYQWADMFQTRLAYSNARFNKDRKDIYHRTTLSLRYDINYNMVSKLEYTDVFLDRETRSNNHYGLFLARLSFSF